MFEDTIMTDIDQILKTIENAIVWHRKQQLANEGKTPLDAAENPLEARELAKTVINHLTKAGYVIGDKPDWNSRSYSRNMNRPLSSGLFCQRLSGSGRNMMDFMRRIILNRMASVDSRTGARFSPG
jgi:hypothetical protein